MHCIVLTPFSHGITKRMQHEDLSIFDYVFCWLGNTNLILSIIKLIEDKMNLDHDIHEAGVLQVGQELDVYVKNVDKEAKRISLSVKDTMRDPWLDKAEKYAEGDHIEGKVIKLTDFGAFMEIEPGFDGLIPMQKWEKISPRMSSVEISPVISPR